MAVGWSLEDFHNGRVDLVVGSLYWLSAVVFGCRCPVFLLPPSCACQLCACKRHSILVGRYSLLPSILRIACSSSLSAPLSSMRSLSSSLVRSARCGRSPALRLLIRSLISANDSSAAASIALVKLTTAHNRTTRASTKQCASATNKIARCDLILTASCRTCCGDCCGHREHSFRYQTNRSPTAGIPLLSHKQPAYQS